VPWWCGEGTRNSSLVLHSIILALPGCAPAVELRRDSLSVIPLPHEPAEADCSGSLSTSCQSNELHPPTNMDARATHRARTNFAKCHLSQLKEAQEIPLCEHRNNPITCLPHSVGFEPWSSHCPIVMSWCRYFKSASVFRYTGRYFSSWFGICCRFFKIL